METVETFFFGISISNDVWIAIELLPIIFAFVAIYFLGKNFNKTESTMRKVFALAMFAATCLIVAQSGWTNAHMNGIPFFKSAFDNIWTIFNITVMSCFIMIGRMK